ncbi:MAG: class I SAM-dependent methyltransferase [Planctomycetota bacterium]
MSKPTETEERWWRRVVGDPRQFDVLGAVQFGLLTMFFGLREQHRLLEIGCGSLRAGKFLIAYLEAGHYFGVDPAKRKIHAGVEHECGDDLKWLKQPTFGFQSDYSFDAFGVTFDYALAYSVLTHAPPGDVVTIFARVGATFHQDSLFLGTAAFADDEQIADPDQWTTVPINRYSPQRFEEAAASAGLRLRRFAGPRPTGQDWFVAYRDGNERVERAAAEADKVAWEQVVPKTSFVAAKGASKQAPGRR